MKLLTYVLFHMQNDIYISGMYIWLEESPMYVINTRISSYCDNYNTVSDALFGFRKGSSTTDATFALLSLIQHYLNNNKRWFVAFIDLKKKNVLILSIVMRCGTSYTKLILKASFYV